MKMPLVHDVYLMQVKKPAESTAPWDYYEPLSVIPGKDAFRSLEDGGCPLVKR
jgi:branched-chain amino acid transport system substrate-binding protein